MKPKPIKAWAIADEDGLVMYPYHVIGYAKSYLDAPHDGERIVRVTITIDEPKKRRARK